MRKVIPRSTRKRVGTEKEESRKHTTVSRSTDANNRSPVLHQLPPEVSHRTYFKIVTPKR